MSARTLTGRHVLIGLLAFFGIVLLANTVFIYLALDTFTGLSTENAYQRGLQYNETLEDRAAQRALGWGGQVSYSESAEGAGVLTAVLKDRGGAPLSGLSVSGEVRRPTYEDHDREVILVRSGPGTYSTELELPLRGQWDVHLVAVSPGGERFEMERRIWLK